ncbi:unnamed protein product (macronuclear) [Paramecium tetraurelia]|uniref:PX domain-containing protein n=1 Tax=Paramecium tetraurelia TaxID=5888 RepID=A0CE52_PARTE|nr:uncharacterized protein GSPATT00037505001 [Paramecium tetraurelia]CAK69069.1 unnamed protein product [Paramecium tetraurelia]|eukprot:XP_001436466.1 hypothetical protein (macronuclear) [Paramecium tetraurelia strain d4-2]
MHSNLEFSCRIPHHQIVNKKIVYVMIFISHSYCSAKVQHLRYSDAEKLHMKLDKSLQQLRISVNLPQFPGKKLFGSHNDSEQGILRRRTELQDYFNQLLKIDKLYSIPYMKSMLPNIIENKNEITQFSQNKYYNIINALRPEQQYNFIIDSFQQLDTFVLYFVQVLDNFNKTKWRFKTRYSDLRDIHQALKEQIKVNIPEFPKRKIFGITNDDPQEIENRKRNLEIYLNSIYAIPELSCTDILDYFIQNSRRESQKLQKFDEQKLLLKLKLQQKQQKQQQIEQLQKKLLNIENPDSDDKTEKQSLKLISQIPRKGLFVIKELIDKYEDDNTTLVRYGCLSTQTLNTVGINQMSSISLQENPCEKENLQITTQPKAGQIIINDLKNDILTQFEDRKEDVQSTDQK